MVLKCKFEKQKDFYLNYRISNYIFVIKNLNEKKESKKDTTYNLCRFLYKDLKLQWKNQ